MGADGVTALFDDAKLARELVIEETEDNTLEAELELATELETELLAELETELAAELTLDFTEDVAEELAVLLGDDTAALLDMEPVLEVSDDEAVLVVVVVVRIGELEGVAAQTRDVEDGNGVELAPL